MPDVTLPELLISASTADEPMFPPKTFGRLGGVDPLGLRQINFDLMDQVIPGLNNTARHIRPFVVIAWAARQAVRIAAAHGEVAITDEQFSDFVDRIQFIYAWSQFLCRPDAGLPGRREFARFANRDRFVFQGARWLDTRKGRAFSTALTAAVNYGPALRALAWVDVSPSTRSVFVPRKVVYPALDAFEKVIARFVDHPAFSQFGATTVTRKEVEAWGKVWRLERPSKAERMVMRDLLTGSGANAKLRAGAELMIATCAFWKTDDVDEVRLRMTQAMPVDFGCSQIQQTQAAWRAVQARQLFRLTLEALMYWMVLHIDLGTRSVDALARKLLECSGSVDLTTLSWLSFRRRPKKGAVEWMAALQSALYVDPNTLAGAIADGLRYSLTVTSDFGQIAGHSERLPLHRARDQAIAFQERPSFDFVQHVMNSWILAQHTYWSVTRGLGDARINSSRRLVRLRIVLDEAGLSLTPGTSTASPPAPTPDRLGTLMSLCGEAGMIGS